jgi:diguanylate cyclase (GGDEF)-like protein
MLKVLIVENNPTLVKLVSHFFEDEGCDVRCAEDGLQAMLILESFIPDILFTDIIMPKINGDQLCRIIRTSPELKHIFIVIYSSIALEDEPNIFDLDADLYIVKGPSTTIQKHVRHVIAQFNQGKRRELVLHGGAGLFSRTITKELLVSKQHHNAVFENLVEAVIEMDDTGLIVRANKAAQELLGRDLAGLAATRLTDYLALAGPEYFPIDKWFTDIAEAGSKDFCSDYDLPLLIGKHKVLLKLLKVPERDGFFLIAILQNITSIKNTERKLALTLNEFNAVMEAIDYGVLFMDSDQKVHIANRAFRKMWGIPDELFAMPSTFRDMINFNRYNNIYDIPEEEFDAYVTGRELEVKNGATGPEEFRRKDGIVYQYQCVVLPDGGRMLTYFDITKHKNTEAELAMVVEKVSDLANRDVLTGLPNLRLFQERFFSTLSISKRKGWKAAIMFLDLDGFKKVNDSFGHEAGDRLLKMVAKRLLETVRKSDTVARIGGDEFLIIQTEVKDKAAAARVAEKIVDRISEPFNLDGNEILIGASIGISMYPANGESSRELIKKADNAMYRTKFLGKRGYTFATD